MLLKRTDLDVEFLKGKLVLYGYTVTEIEDGSGLEIQSHTGTISTIPWALLLKIIDVEYATEEAKKKYNKVK